NAQQSTPGYDGRHRTEVGDAGAATTAWAVAAAGTAVAAEPTPAVDKVNTPARPSMTIVVIIALKLRLLDMSLPTFAVCMFPGHLRRLLVDPVFGTEAPGQ
ncbi:MAG TPA: hypothetical protein VEO01_10820, partial [Pseudonocardiaceae bacterium]|nr:hypothetical protein [Pseudonocardiaceae bacterium]